jgi:hypothetical protein
MNFDLNVDNYSVPEILDILNIDNKEFNANIHNKAWLFTKIKVYTDEINKSDLKETELNELLTFLKRAFQKIYDDKQEILPIELDERTIQELMHEKNVNHMYQEDSRPIVNTHPKQYRKGTINPLDKQTNRITLNINTRFRKNYYNTSSSDFVLDLPNPLKNVVSMKIDNIEMPDMHYNFSEKIGTDEFSIDVYDYNESSGEKSNEKKYVIKIQNGNYTSTQLRDYLNSMIFNTYVDENLSIIQCDYNINTNKFRFLLDPSYSSLYPNKRFNLDFRLNNDDKRNLQLNVGWMLGFRKPYYDFSQDYVTQDQVSVLKLEGYEPEAGFNGNSTNYFFLHIGDYNNNKNIIMDTPYQQGMISSTELMAKMPIMQNTSFTTTLPMGGGGTGATTIPSTISTITSNTLYNLNFKKRQYYGPVNIQKLEIKLLDEFGRIVDLQKNDYSFSLEIETLYEL